MTSARPIAVIGAGHHAAELQSHAAPVEGIEIAACAPAPGEADGDASERFAHRLGAAYSPNWKPLVDDPNLPGILALGPAPGRAQVLEAALNAGKVAVCPFPPALDTAGLERLADARRRGGGALLSVSELAGTGAGAHALEAVREGRLGKLHSVWVAARYRVDAGAAESVLDQCAWPVLDFVLTAVQGPAVRVHAALAALFERGPQPDTAVVLIRFEQDVVATLELSRCLPRSIAAPERGEVEIELIGAKEVVRIEPHRSSVSVYETAGASARSWIDGPLVRTLPLMGAALQAKDAGECCLERAGRAIAIMDAIKRFQRPGSGGADAQD